MTSEELITQLLHALGRANRALATKASDLWKAGYQTPAPSFDLTVVEVFDGAPPERLGGCDNVRIDGQIEATDPDGLTVMWSFEVRREDADVWLLERSVRADGVPVRSFSAVRFAGSEQLADGLAAAVTELLASSPVSH